MLAQSQPDVCIVGAGCSGFTAAKILHERGIAFDCFEQGSNIGGLWRYENDSGTSAAYKSLHINTSRDKMAFSDFPMPRDYPDFPHHSLIIRYFESYVDHFGFRSKITFQTSVISIQPRDNGTYDVTTRARSGDIRTKNYRSVLVANGHHWKPRTPDFPGDFSGSSLHSHDYREPSSMVGKRVLVIGIGNSGCDIACEVSRVAERTYLSTRSGAHIIPKYIFGKPLDKIAPVWFWKHLPFPIFQRIFAAALRLSRGRLSRFGLPTPQHKILQEHPTISNDLLNLLGHGKISIKPNVSRFADRVVHFADGSEEEIDQVVYATGYQIAFPFLAPEILDTQANRVGLYKHVVHTDLTNLYFIGLIQPWGAIMPLAEQQAEWAADLIENKCCLPSPDAMRKDIDLQRNKMQRRYVSAPRHTIQVDFYSYLEQIERERKRKSNVLVQKKSQPINASQRKAA